MGGARRRAAAALVLVLAASASPASGGPPLLELPTVRDRCGPEIERFCGDVLGEEESALASCIAAHRFEVSGECLGGLAARAVQRWSWRDVCRSDLARFCPESMRDAEPALECLERVAWKLDPLCRTRTRVAVVWAERIMERLERLVPR